MNSSNFDVLGKFMNTYLNSVGTAYANITPEVHFFMAGMITLVIAITALFTFIWGDWETVVRGLVGKIILIGFFLYLIDNWPSLTNDIGLSMTQLGLSAGGQGTSATTFLQNPITIVVTGIQLCLAICQNADHMSGGGIMGLDNFGTKLIMGLAAIGVFLSFAILALQVVVTFLEFKLVNVAAFIFLPFGVWQKTAFLSDRSIGFVFSAGSKLFMLALVVSIGEQFVTQFTVSTTPDVQNALVILMGSLMLMMVSIAVPRLAAALISGGPQLGAGDAAMGAGALAGTVGGAGLAAGRALGGAGQIGGAVTGAAVNNVHQAEVEQMRRAATVGGGGNANATTLAQMAKAATTDSGSSPPNIM